MQQYQGNMNGYLGNQMSQMQNAAQMQVNYIQSMSQAGLRQYSQAVKSDLDVMREDFKSYLKDWNK